MADIQTLRGQLKEFFEDIKRFGPRRGSAITLDPPAPPQDAGTVWTDAEMETTPHEGNFYAHVETTAPPPVVPFPVRGPGPRAPLAAVDAGVMQLGESADGLVIALRGAILVQDGERRVTGLVRSGPIYLGWEHEADLLLRLGQWLGDPKYYVVTERLEGGSCRAVRLKDGVGGRKYLADRFRAGLERYCQRLAAASVKDGTLLLDGALTLRSRDTPDAFLNQIAYLARREGNNVIGLSKTSELVVGGRAVPYWLDDHPAAACHRALTPILRGEDAQAPSHRVGRADRVLGCVYAARLSALGPTLRMDVKARPGGDDQEAIERFHGSVDLYCGYPSVLARAHAACYVSAAHFLALQVQAVREFGLRPRRRAGISGAFGPFGGTFK